MFELDNLSVGFGSATALRRASLTIRPGDRLGIVGESGSGKTMLALCLMGMAPGGAQLSGTLRIDGQDMTHASETAWQSLRARRVAMIFQEPMAALNPLVRVGDTVAEPIRVHEGLSRHAAHDRVLALFEEVGIPDPAARMRQFPHELSGGQRQRVLIALALACDPALLIADEPTTALDANIALRITDLLVRLAEQRDMALVFITHDLAAVARATRDIVVMYGGDMVERGPTDAVLSDPAHPYTRGLLAARPDPVAQARVPGQPRPRLPTIPGTVPGLQDLPQGCRFSGRCPVEIARCASARPGRTDLSAGRSACCHLLTEGTT
ncbi:putative D,D-dipeptide transport ATP-binding protein DdpD (plasmid) [Sulfitobacter sp. THAF37]|uniref:ABC transporter ATP-binding protein n=1 Tax=Sulfitobacter sp. THAF37 TaxID=2587855 RepID=UPI00126907B1|nr:ABC transporter ATP-binding protein [Sulfitobacter sp. THAF37]QFT61080.1 putative D,D-dipeptide transport ATP-binding protein DdpD [Sulfitobacter sp. THAF37]